MGLFTYKDDKGYLRYRSNDQLVHRENAAKKLGLSSSPARSFIIKTEIKQIIQRITYGFLKTNQRTIGLIKQMLHDLVKLQVIKVSKRRKMDFGTF